jgi:hypothetical protein
VPLEVSAVGSVRIPLIRMQLEGSTSGRVEVPAQIGNRPIQWVGRGVEELTGTEDQPLPAGTRRFEVVDVNYALTGNIEAPTAEAQIYLEDLYFQWRDAQGAIAWISYDLHSGGAASCDLRLPQGATLVQVSVDDQPALAELHGKNRWEVVLGTTRYPQRMTLILKYDAPQHAGVQPIDLPELRFGGRRRSVARQRLVTVVSPGQAGPAMGSAALRAVRPSQLQLLRRKHLEELIRANWPTAGTGRQTTELAAWQTRLKELETAEDAGSQPPASSLAPGAGGDARPGLGGGPERWRWILGSDVRYTCLVAPSENSQIVVHYPRDTRGAGRWLLFAAGLAAAVCLARPSSWQWIEPQMSRWLPAGVVLAGLLISQSVWPAFLGWLVVVGGVWAAAWPLWAGRRLRQG